MQNQSTRINGEPSTPADRGATHAAAEQQITIVSHDKPIDVRTRSESFVGKALSALREPSPVLRPTLDAVFGTAPAILIHQIHFNIENSRKNRQAGTEVVELDGHAWLKATYPELAADLRNFRDPYHLRRIIKGRQSKTKQYPPGLQALGVVILGDFPTSRGDLTNWFRVDLEQLGNLIDAYEQRHPLAPKVQTPLHQARNPLICKSNEELNRAAAGKRGSAAAAAELREGQEEIIAFLCSAQPDGPGVSEATATEKTNLYPSIDLATCKAFWGEIRRRQHKEKIINPVGLLFRKMKDGDKPTNQMSLFTKSPLGHRQKATAAERGECASDIRPDDRKAARAAEESTLAAFDDAELAGFADQAIRRIPEDQRKHMQPHGWRDVQTWRKGVIELARAALAAGNHQQPATPADRKA